MQELLPISLKKGDNSMSSNKGENIHTDGSLNLMGEDKIGSTNDWVVNGGTWVLGE